MIFRTALLEPELELKIVRNMKKPAIPPKPASFRSNNKLRSTLSEINQNNDLSFVDNDSNMNSLNTRRLGKIIKITLVKGKRKVSYLINESRTRTLSKIRSLTNDCQNYDTCNTHMGTSTSQTQFFLFERKHSSPSGLGPTVFGFLLRSRS